MSLCWLKMGQGDRALMDAQYCRMQRPGWAKACYLQGAAQMLLKDAQNRVYLIKELDRRTRQVQGLYLAKFVRSFSRSSSDSEGLPLRTWPLQFSKGIMMNPSCSLQRAPTKACCSKGNKICRKKKNMELFKLNTAVHRGDGFNFNCRCHLEFTAGLTWQGGMWPMRTV